jgi:hypothetical protein
VGDGGRKKEAFVKSEGWHLLCSSLQIFGILKITMPEVPGCLYKPPAVSACARLIIGDYDKYQRYQHLATISEQLGDPIFPDVTHPEVEFTKPASYKACTRRLHQYPLYLKV